jgi:hypothetical protein
MTSRFHRIIKILLLAFVILSFSGIGLHSSECIAADKPTAKPTFESNSKKSGAPIVQAKKREPGIPSNPAPTPSTNPEPKIDQPPPEPKSGDNTPQASGKRREPGQRPPGMSEEGAQGGPFTMERDPFRIPTDEFPSECPPSRPLCKFDRSQLKLVGIIQVSDGNFKGMVEDPDGRGYYVTTGMMIGKATITQISNRGITLYDHRNNTDTIMTLASEGYAAGER